MVLAVALGGDFHAGAEAYVPGPRSPTPIAASFRDPDGTVRLLQEISPPHNRWDWYAGCMDSRERGNTPEEASAAGGYMAEVKQVVVSALELGERDAGISCDAVLPRLRRWFWGYGRLGELHLDV
jgi:hypothetical protein